MKTSANQMLSFYLLFGISDADNIDVATTDPRTISANIMVSGAIAVCLVADSLMSHTVRFDSLLTTAFLLLCTLDKVHVLVEPSLTASDGDQEGIAVTIIEAMASREHITQRHSAVDRPWGERIPFPAEDMASLASHPVPLIERPGLRREVGQAGHKIVRDTFALRLRRRSWNSYFADLLRIS
jgi:hypothetical protein